MPSNGFVLCQIDYCLPGVVEKRVDDVYQGGINEQFDGQVSLCRQQFVPRSERAPNVVRVDAIEVTR